MAVSPLLYLENRTWMMPYHEFCTSNQLELGVGFWRTVVEVWMHKSQPSRLVTNDSEIAVASLAPWTLHFWTCRVDLPHTLLSWNFHDWAIDCPESFNWPMWQSHDDKSVVVVDGDKVEWHCHPNHSPQSQYYPMILAWVVPLTPKQVDHDRN